MQEKGGPTLSQLSPAEGSLERFTAKAGGLCAPASVCRVRQSDSISLLINKSLVWQIENGEIREAFFFFFFCFSK